MQLDRVQINQFRNLSLVDVYPCDGINLLVGDNGSGKTSFLEALHLLSFGRSFRTYKYQSLIQQDTNRLTLFGQLSNKQKPGDNHKVGISRHANGGVDIQIDGEKRYRSSDLAHLLPMQVFTPQSSDTISGSPGLRRSFIDWGLFHVEQEFLSCSGMFNKTLKQRNALLKSSEFNQQQDRFWRDTLAASGTQLTTYRQHYLDNLIPYIERQMAHFLPEFCLEIAYYKGWEKELSLEQSLAKHADKDKIVGHTIVGPHKADIRLKVSGRPVQEVLSRGQLRMLMAALQIAQSQLLLEQRQSTCIYLLDDIGAELDAEKRELFINQLIQLQAQIFVTTTELSQVTFLSNFSTIKMFHVEQGQVKEENATNG